MIFRILKELFYLKNDLLRTMQIGILFQRGGGDLEEKFG